MKTILLLAIVAMSAQVAVAQNAAGERKKAEKDNTLYIIDGKVVSKDAFKAVPPEEVQDIDVYKGVSGAMVMNTKKVYKGDSGAMVVNPKKADVKAGNYVKVGIYPSEMDMESITKMNNHIRVMLRGEGDKDFTKVNPLIVVKDNEGNVKVAKTMDEIKVENIKLITVRKDKNTDEFKKYGDVSKGVIIVELR